MATIHCTPELFAGVFTRTEHQRLDDFDAAVLRGAQDGAKILRENAPEDLGGLRDSIVMEPGDGRGGSTRIIATVVVNAPHAAAVERGRRAGAAPPPIAKIEEWCQRHGMMPGAGFVVARKIAVEGIRPTWFARRSLPKMAEALAPHIEAALR